ncbi:MAG: glycosyltransferase family 4 protein [Steroidobacterales bacterium]|jgi:glycosyltransferase involved in cell wall biosynthesis
MMGAPTPSAPANAAACAAPGSVCFVGLGNLPVLAREYSNHRAGGAELQQTLLARALARSGWRVSMVVADYGQPDGQEWDGIKTYKAYGPDEGLALVRFLHPRWTKLHAALRRADADIYYTSCAGGHLAQIALFARRRGRRIIFRIASDTDCDPRALLVRYWRDRMLYRWGLAHTDLLLAQTPSQQRALASNFGRDSRLAGSLLETSGRCPPRAQRDIDVLWVGNLRPLKRPHLFLDVASRLPRLSFHMIGGPMPGAARLYEQVRLRAAPLANVTFHGFVPQHQVGEYFERARLFVSTSEIEGFPNTYLQAWSRGTPVVAFLDPEGLLARNRLGARVSSVAELQAAVATLIQDSPKWEGASARARSYIAARADEATTLSAYTEALSGLLCASRVAGSSLGRKSWHISSPG